MDIIKDLREGFNDLPQDAQDVVLLLLGLVAIFLLQFVVRWLLIRLLRRLAENNKSEWERMLRSLVGMPTRLLMLALALWMVSSVLRFDGTIEVIFERGALSLMVIAVVMLVYSLISRATRTEFVLENLTGLDVEPQLLPFLRTGLRLLLLVFAIALILEQWGYNVSTLVAGLGIGGLAIALAAQDSLANLFGFTTIVGDNPFDIGEFIVTPDVSGTVESVGLRSTRIRQLDQALVTVPNKKLADAAVLNWTRLSKRQINLTVGVTYATNSSQMRELLERIREMLKARDSIDDESVVAYLIDFGDSSLNILVRCFVALPDWAAFTAEKEQVLLAIMDIVEELGLSLAFPTRSIYLENLSPELRKVLPQGRPPTVAVTPARASRFAETDLPDNVPSDTPNDFPDFGEENQGEQGEDRS